MQLLVEIETFENNDELVYLPTEVAQGMIYETWMTHNHEPRARLMTLPPFLPARLPNTLQRMTVRATPNVTGIIKQYYFRKWLDTLISDLLRTRDKEIN